MSKKDRNEDKRIEKQQRALKEQRRKKRLPIIFGVVVVGIGLLIGGTVLSNSYDTTKQTMADLYQNEISYEQLKTKIANKEDVYAYFYQPDCEHCKYVSPVLIPLAEELKKPLLPVNIKNQHTAWDENKIEGTPTVIHFKDGKEVDRIAGEHDKDTYTQYLSK